MNVDAFILARLGSSRLPQKHLLEIQDKPIIQHLFERISKCKTIRKIVVCTTDNISDDPLINFLEKEKITWFRGSEHDIVKRLLDAAKNYDTDLIVDIEGDKIYTEPEFVDRSVHMMLNSDYDFLMGSSSPTSVDHSDHSVAAVFPAIIKKSALEKVNSTKNHNNNINLLKNNLYEQAEIKSTILKLNNSILDTSESADGKENVLNNDIN